MSPTLMPLLRGRALTASDVAWRHRFVCIALAVHVPLVLGLALAAGHSVAEAALETGLVAGLLAVALLAPPRQVRSAAATLGLVTSSALLVRLNDVTEAHFHYFVVGAAVALYQDWRLLALVIGFALVQLGLVAPGEAAAGEAAPGERWTSAGLLAAFLLVQSAVFVVFWHVNEASRAGAERLQHELSEGRSSVQARLDETERIRHDLIGTVSHEFRTPLTGIRGAALTLLKRGERLPDSHREFLLKAVLEQQERLSRLLENMLVAAQATAADPAAAAEVDAVAAEVAMLAGAARPGSAPVSVVVEPDLTAHIDRQALHQVLANLVDNAQEHGVSTAVPILAGGSDEHGVWVSVSNEGRPLPEEQLTRLFEPFTQADAGPTRMHEGVGLGLYVVRRLVEVYGGQVLARSEAGWTTVEVRLQPARPHGAPLPRARASA